jgi:hypothetical protein
MRRGCADGRFWHPSCESNGGIRRILVFESLGTSPSFDACERKKLTIIKLSGNFEYDRLHAESRTAAAEGKDGYTMKAVSGVFRSRSDAERAIAAMNSVGMSQEQITLLTPGDGTGLQSVPADAAEQPGMGKAIAAVLGGTAGLSGAALIIAAIPGVGPITAIGLLGSAILGAAGAGVGAAAGGKLENSMTEGLPEDELFVYEDALRRGRSVVIALVEDDSAATHTRELLSAEGAEAVDAARDQWWIGLRDAEREHYSALGRNFGNDERLYRLGFESALHARTRCKEYDQVMAEMTAQIEDLERQYPGVDVAEPFTRGYERGRDYYQQLCDKSKAA